MTPRRAKVVKLNGATARQGRAAGAAIATPSVSIGSDTGSSKNWVLVALLATAIAVLGVAAAPLRAFPRPVAHVLAMRRIEIAFVGAALVVGVGFSMLLAAVLS